MAQGSSARLSPTEGRRFAFTLMAAFGVLTALLWWREHETPAAVAAESQPSARARSAGGIVSAT